MLKLLTKEKPGEFEAFKAYVATGDLTEGYNKYMQDHLDSGLSFKKYISLSSEFHWIVRLNDHNAAEDLRLRQETRKKNLYNNLTAEDVAKELFIVCMEQIDLNPNMDHNDVAKYLKIATDITKGENTDSPVNIHVNQNQGIVEVDSETLRELGKKIVYDHDSNQ